MADIHDLAPRIIEAREREKLLRLAKDALRPPHPTNPLVLLRAGRSDISKEWSLFEYAHNRWYHSRECTQREVRALNGLDELGMLSYHPSSVPGWQLAVLIDERRRWPATEMVDGGVRTIIFP